MKLFDSLRKTKLFTLIELIVVIVVLGILAAIVIPNISSFKEEAEYTSIISNSKNLQTSVDLFMLENNGVSPTKEKPTFGNPQVLQVHGLHPEYTRDLPKNKGVHWWLDQNYSVWASYVDAPSKVTYAPNSNGTAKLTWETVDGADLYKVYKSADAIAAKADNGMQFVDEMKVARGSTPEINVPELSKGVYLVTAVDEYQFETVPTAMNGSYEGYTEPEKDFSIPSTKEPVNEKPVAVISMNPSANLDTNTTITWGHSLSSDPEGDDIVEVEWMLNGVVKSNPNGKLPLGSHKMELRVKDSKGNWSDAAEQTFEVRKPPIQAPNLSLALALDGDNSTYVTLPGTFDVSIDPSLGGKKLGILSRADSTCYVSTVYGYARYKGQYNYNSSYIVDVGTHDPKPKYGTITLPANVDTLRLTESESCGSFKNIKLYEITILN